MSLNSLTNIWLHLIWGTHDREKSLLTQEFRKSISEYLSQYSKQKGIYMKINYVNSNHVHALINLPTNKTIEDVMHLLKGSSSYWINERVNFKFRWAKGYAVFSVDKSDVNRITDYIANQDEHHRIKSFSEEYNKFAEQYKL